MDGKRQCPSCGRQFEEAYQFCPFDGTTIGKKCPSCGKTWDSAYQFCPLDSTPLSPASPAQPSSQALPPQPPLMQAPPPAGPAVAPPVRPAGEQAFTYIEQSAKTGWKATLLRPVTILFAVGVALVSYFVWYLNWRTSGPDLPPPTISYTLLPNEGKTKGVPVAIKVNQLSVFMIDDPMESEGAARAKKLVATLDETIRPLTKTTGEVRFAVERVGGRPAILVVTPNGPEPRPLATVSEGDATLAGESDADRLAAQWAERLTDAVKVFVFGEAPTFSTGTEFGQALLVMYKGAVGDRGKLTKRSLDNAFEKLTAAQRRALETPPLARKTTAANLTRR